MTDLKALRREMAEKLAQDLDYGGTPRAIVQAAIESALLQYALAALGEPSEAMVEQAYILGRDCKMCVSTIVNPHTSWQEMAAQRAKELE